MSKRDHQNARAIRAQWIPPSDIVPGDILRSTIIPWLLGRVVRPGEFKFGRQRLPGYVVTILNGHEAGHTSFMIADQSEKVLTSE